MSHARLPTISVVIPTYNRAETIEQALESVYAQTCTDYEIIVVDDGSTDGTDALLAKHARGNKVRSIYQANAGVSAARNRGVEMAGGRYIAFLDSDDLFVADKLAKQLAVFGAMPDLGFVHANFAKFNDAGEDLGVRDMSHFQGRVYPWILQEWSALMALPSLLVRRDVFFEVGGFDETITWGEDIDLYFRIARRYNLGMVPEVLCKVRVHPGSASASKLGSAESFHRVLEKAIRADQDLPEAFARQAFAKLYTNKSQNLLGEGDGEHMRTARRYAVQALTYQPFELGAWAALGASLLPKGLRKWLAAKLRQQRYPSRKS